MISYALLFQRNEFRSLALVCVVQIGIDLSCRYILMSEHLRYSIDARSHTNLKGSECMPETMVVKPKINGRQMNAIRDVKR